VSPHVQVLLGDCSQEEVAEQATGVIEAVLQGRNSVVLALGQAGSGKSHTMLGNDPGDPDSTSTSGGLLLSGHNNYTVYKPFSIARKPEGEAYLDTCLCLRMTNGCLS